MRTISLRLPNKLLEELRREAKARRVSKSAIIRQSLELAFGSRSANNFVSCYDLARDLAGRPNGVPRDLAENLEYIKGFGD